MKKLLFILSLCCVLALPVSAVSLPSSETATPVIAAETPTGVGDSVETSSKTTLSPEAKKLIAAAVGSGIIAGTAMVYIFKKKSK